MRGVVLFLLAALAIQNCVATVLVRYAKRDVQKTEQFHNSSVILHQEIVKLIISAAIVVVETKKVYHSSSNTSLINNGSRRDLALTSPASLVEQNVLLRGGSSITSTPTPVTVTQPVELDFVVVENDSMSISRDRRVALKGRMNSSLQMITQVAHRVMIEVFTPDVWRVFIPAFLYTAQSILGFLALNSLDPVTYQCFSQVKMLFVTVISVAVLRRVVHPVQWVSLLFLTIGLVLIPLGKQDPAESPASHQQQKNSNDSALGRVEWLGVLYVLSSCLASSYASIYLEWVMTSLRSATVAARNVQLSLFGMVFACISLYVLDIRPNWIAQNKAVQSGRCHQSVHYNIFTRREGYHSASAKWPGVRSGCVHPFYVWERFDRWSVWAVILVQSIGGLMIGFTMALSDSVMKSLSSAFSTVLSALIAHAKHDFNYSWVSLFGGVLSLCSSYLFNVLERERKKTKCG